MFATNVVTKHNIAADLFPHTTVFKQCIWLVARFQYIFAVQVAVVRPVKHAQQGRVDIYL
ncbi:hypothetical protein CLV51_103393 [Chitinophaga niastensis]|uniref:Uncharacterized protein n=1 Tax=Chitinophaga niastensis TaxID=536980 RepID=A0A2P8HJN3_CHINA|nr:hypothetical protein CLV51_103393 [Chitinophaga niastensis]